MAAWILISLGQENRPLIPTTSLGAEPFAGVSKLTDRDWRPLSYAGRQRVKAWFFIAATVICSACSSEAQSWRQLLFRRTMFNLPRPGYVLVTAAPETRQFKAPVIMHELPADVEQRMNQQALEVAHIFGGPEGVVGIEEASPEQRLLIVAVQTRYPESGNDSVMIPRAHLVDLEKAEILKVFPPLSSAYLARDSKSCFFLEGSEVKRWELAAKTERVIAQSTCLLMTGSGDELVLFWDGEIRAVDYEGKLSRILGRYRHQVYAGGRLDATWLYYLTSFSAKGGKKSLWFLNPATKQVVRYPHKLPEVWPMRIQ